MKSKTENEHIHLIADDQESHEHRDKDEVMEDGRWQENINKKYRKSREIKRKIIKQKNRDEKTKL